MIKTHDMDKFLSNLKKLYLHNPDLPINSDTIYHSLSNYGLDKKEIKDCNIRYMFPELENIFVSSNLHVYVDERQRRFLQFAIHNGHYKYVKLYVSFPKKYIEQAAVKIFEFIAQNNMITASKLSDTIRSDSIVMRIADPNDAKKVLDFINSDKELLKYHQKTNPFSLKEGIVGIGYDDMLSYNMTVAKLMTDYFQVLRNNNALKQASLEQFADYAANYYYSVFVSKENLLNFMETDMYKESRLRFRSDGESVNNYDQVISLIALTLKDKLTVEKYFSLFNQFCIENKTDYYTQEIIKLRNNKSVDENTEKLEDRKQLLDEYIKYAIGKYGFSSAILYVESYMNGNNCAITKDNNYRNRFISFLNPELVRNMVGEDLKMYMVSVSKEVSNTPTKDSFQDNYNFFIEACMATLYKYDAEQLYTALKHAMVGDFCRFTNDGASYRTRMKNSFNGKMISDFLTLYLQEKNYTMSFDMDLARLFVNDISNNQLDIAPEKVV